MSKKVLVITGASKGIGRSTASIFLQSGYKVINLSRSNPNLDNIIHISADFSDSDWPSKIKEELEGHLDSSKSISLIHSAGLLLKDSIEDVSSENFMRVLQVNIISATQLNQILLPFMADGSSIIYIGSTLSEKGVANSCSYVTSKHAVVGLMRSTTQDLVGKGIHTTCICPGFTDTEMLKNHVGGSKEILREISKGIAFNRLVNPEEIAKTLFFAAENPVLNGSIIHANLGQIEK
jgi:3-oxoacyl-[acyl-carrier protein] reductase